MCSKVNGNYCGVIAVDGMNVQKEDCPELQKNCGCIKKNLDLVDDFFVGMDEYFIDDAINPDKALKQHLKDDFEAEKDRIQAICPDVDVGKPACKFMAAGGEAPSPSPSSDAAATPAPTPEVAASFRSTLAFVTIAGLLIQ